jgi:hypothetical protein
VKLLSFEDDQFKFEVQHLLKTDAERKIRKSGFDGAKPLREMTIRGCLRNQKLSNQANRLSIIRIIARYRNVSLDSRRNS